MSDAQSVFATVGAAHVFLDQLRRFARCGDLGWRLDQVRHRISLDRLRLRTTTCGALTAGNETVRFSGARPFMRTALGGLEPPTF